MKTLHPIRSFHPSPRESYLFIYFFPNQNKRKRWEKIFLMKQSHGSSLSYLMVSTLDNPHAIRGCTMKQSHKINFPMHGGHRIMHLSQKENNSGFSAFKIISICGFSLFQKGISKFFFFFFKWWNLIFFAKRDHS